jgi:uncharacterized protein YbjT (DUF2867 family)
MKILLTGATGFIGGHLHAALRRRGHEVVCAGRRPPPDGGRWVALDYGDAVEPQHWREAVAGVDAAINTVGLFRERPGASFDLLHRRAPIALFDACLQAGVRRVVQLSALGAAQGATAYQRSKHAADEHLLALPLDGCVAQPSLVFGVDGPSARWFLQLASLPLLPLPAGGRQALQPVHVDDAVQALCALVESPPGRWRARRIALVGPEPQTLRDYLQALRRGLLLPPAAVVAVPRPLVTLAARLGDRRPDGLLDSASWQMLELGNVAPAGDVTELLGHAPRPSQAFIAAPLAGMLRNRSQLDWLLQVLRLSLALVWIVTGIVSFGVYPVADSYELLARAGVPAALQPTMLFGAAGLDLLLGVLTLWPPRSPRHRRALWLAQAALMAVYMVIIAIRLPEFWIHPYGPLLKNLPILAILVLLYTLDAPEQDAPRRAPAGDG